MRAPPPVAIELGAVGWVRAAIAALHALAAAALAAWMAGWLHDAADMVVTSLAGLGAGGVGAWVGWRSHRPVTGRLAWDGRGWSLRGEAGRLQLLIDAGPWLGLRFHPHGAVRHAGPGFVVTRSAAGANWHALRAAVYCPATDDTAAGRTAPPDRPA